MTAQASDTVVHRDWDYKIAHMTGTGMANPFASLGYRPHWTCTACYAGYLAEYTIAGDRLYLSAFQVAPPDDAATPLVFSDLPKLFGHSCTHEGSLGMVCYGGFLEPMPFTGGMLLGRRFIHDLYVHSGSHPIWKYEVVLEVIFDAGMLVKEHDRSPQMAVFREQRNQLYNAASSRISPTHSNDYRILADKVDLMLAACFSLDYRLGPHIRPPDLNPTVSG